MKSVAEYFEAVEQAKQQGTSVDLGDSSVGAAWRAKNGTFLRAFKGTNLAILVNEPEAGDHEVSGHTFVVIGDMQTVVLESVDGGGAKPDSFKNGNGSPPMGLRLAYVSARPLGEAGKFWNESDGIEVAVYTDEHTANPQLVAMKDGKGPFVLPVEQLSEEGLRVALGAGKRVVPLESFPSLTLEDGEAAVVAGEAPLVPSYPWDVRGPLLPQPSGVDSVRIVGGVIFSAEQPVANNMARTIGNDGPMAKLMASIPERPSEAAIKSSAGTKPTRDGWKAGLNRWDQKLVSGQLKPKMG